MKKKKNSYELNVTRDVLSSCYDQPVRISDELKLHIDTERRLTEQQRRTQVGHQHFRLMLEVRCVGVN